MTRETRLNLLFLVALIVLTLPGAIILFKKKLDPYAPSNMLPEGRPRTTAYIDPGPLPPGIARVVPPDATTWTASLRNGPPIPDPIISAHRVFEIVDLKATPQSCEVFLIVWARGYTDPGTQLSADLATATQTVTSQIRTGDPIALPHNVLRTLQIVGYTRTPHQVQSAHFHFDVDKPNFPLTVNLTAAIGDHRIKDSVKIFTNPFANLH